MSDADVAASLGVQVPDGIWSSPESITQWTQDASESIWSQAMGPGDARQLWESVAPEISKAAKALKAATGPAGSAVAGALAAAGAIAGAVAAIAYFIASAKNAAESLDAQRDTMREAKRVNTIETKQGFNPGRAVFLQLGPWSDCGSWRSPWSCDLGAWWQPAPGWSPFFETTAACFPAWNPYRDPAPHKPAEGIKTRVNEVLIAYQLEGLTSPYQLIKTPPELLASMGAKASAARAGQELVTTTGLKRRITALDVELWRRGIGKVAAARAALLRQAPDQVAQHMTWQVYDAQKGKMVRRWVERSDWPSDAYDIGASFWRLRGNLEPPPPATVDTARLEAALRSPNRAPLILGGIAALGGAYLLSRRGGQ